MIDVQDNIINEIILVIAGYFLGCICAGYYLVKFYSGKDIRTLGSGGLGARNVGRVLGKTGFFVTLMMDAGKCYLIVAFVSSQLASPYFQFLIIIITMIGHIWPMQLNFKGGKGYATMVGGVLAYDLTLFLLLLLLAAIFVSISRRSILSGLMAVILSPVVALIYGEPQGVILGFVIIAMLLSYTHENNIRSEIKFLSEKEI